jgi:hypothetical protein
MCRAPLDWLGTFAAVSIGAGGEGGRSPLLRPSSSRNKEIVAREPGPLDWPGTFAEVSIGADEDGGRSLLLPSFLLLEEE